METPLSQSPVNDNAGSHGRRSMSDPLTTMALKSLPNTAVADDDRVQKKSTLSDLRWWLPELFASFLAFASLASIVAVFRAYRDETLRRPIASTSHSERPYCNPCNDQQNRVNGPCWLCQESGVLVMAVRIPWPLS